MNTFFTADTHFGHDAIIRHQHRPFASTKEHDDALVHNWNSVVRPNDIVYHVGDFAWHNLEVYFRRLHGQIHLVKGNHDRLKAGDKLLFRSISDIKKVRAGEQKIYLCHYAFRVWNCSHHGSWQLYGHSHGSLTDDPYALSLDVGVDCHNYFPISLEQVTALMSKKNWRPVDHHGIL